MACRFAKRNAESKDPYRIPSADSYVLQRPSKRTLLFFERRAMKDLARGGRHLSLATTDRPESIHARSFTPAEAGFRMTPV